MSRRHRTAMRWRKGDTVHNLLKATSDWVRSRGGKLFVIGGIETQDYGEPYKFKVAIGCMGRKPVSRPTSGRTGRG